LTVPGSVSLRSARAFGPVLSLSALRRSAAQGPPPGGPLPAGASAATLTKPSSTPSPLLARNSLPPPVPRLFETPQGPAPGGRGSQDRTGEASSRAGSTPARRLSPAGYSGAFALRSSLHPHGASHGLSTSPGRLPGSPNPGSAPPATPFPGAGSPISRSASGSPS